MSRDGSGSMSLPAGNPVVDGTPIDPVVHNATNSDIAAELTNSIARDGQSVPFSNLPMGGFRHTSVSPAVLGNEYSTLSQSQVNVAGYVLDTSAAANTITVSPVPAVSSYDTGQRWRVKLAQTNTGQSNITVSGLVAKRVLLQGKAALYNGALLAGNIADLSYDGADFICLNPVPAAAVPPPVTNAVLQVQSATTTAFQFNPSAAQLAAYSKFQFRIGPNFIIDGPANIRIALSNTGGATFFQGPFDYVGAFELVNLGTSSAVLSYSGFKDGGGSLPLTGSGVQDGQFISGEVEIVFQPGLCTSYVIVNSGSAYVCRAVGARTSGQNHNAVSFFSDPAVLMTGEITMVGIL